jgi:hypothetical protein
MSVDERLRAGLESLAVGFVPDAEPRLSAVRRRHRRRTAVIAGSGAVGVLAAVTVLVAVLGRSPQTAPDPIDPVSPSPPSASTGAPDGTWVRTVTRAQARDAGVARSWIREELGADGRLLVVLVIAGDRYAQAGSYREVAIGIGDSGAVSYDRQDRMVLTSESPGCPGCEARLSWRVEGDTLVLDRAGGPTMAADERLMVLGRWKRS